MKNNNIYRYLAFKKPNMQEKTINENGEYLPDINYDGFSKIIADVNSGQGGVTKELVPCYKIFNNHYIYIDKTVTYLTSSELTNNYIPFDDKNYCVLRADKGTSDCSIIYDTTCQTFCFDFGEAPYPIYAMFKIKFKDSRVNKARVVQSSDDCPNDFTSGFINVSSCVISQYNTEALEASGTNDYYIIPIYRRYLYFYITNNSSKVNPDDYITMWKIFGLDSSDATATKDDIAFGKTAYVNNSKIIGSNTSITPVVYPDDLIQINYKINSSKDIVEAEMKNGKSVLENMFTNLGKLQKAIIPNTCTSIGYKAFYQCYKLTEINIPEGLTTLGTYAFYGCEKLTNINLPNTLKTISQHAFGSCKSFYSIKIPKSVTNIGYYSFRNSAFKNIYIGSTSSITVDATAFESTVNNLYVGWQKGEVANYPWGTSTSATNIWYGYDIDTDFAGYVDSITKIDDTNATVVVKYKNLDESRNFTISVVPKDSKTIISDIDTSTDNTVTFNMNTEESSSYTTDVDIIFKSGDVILKTVSCKYDFIIIGAGSVYVYHSLDTTGFSKLDDGYYKSNCKGVGNGYSLAKVIFNDGGTGHLQLLCNNSGEDNFDYGYLSNIDTEFVANNAVDSSGVFKSYKGNNMAENVYDTVDYESQGDGVHYIYVKYRKDSSGNSLRDSFVFKASIVSD